MSLSPIVKETVNLLRASLPATVEIVLKATSAPDVVCANPTEIQQIVMNLCTNAAHAMSERGGKLKISLAASDVLPGLVFEPELPSNGFVQLTVQDTGMGMDPNTMERIFEPFFTTKGIGEGTGIGLAVVRGIVKSLNGEIIAQSKPGVGSTFRVILPRVVKDDMPRDRPQPEELTGGAEHILFVDDEELLTELGKELLERLGYEVTAMTDSAKALKSFSKNPARFHLVITDQTMPKITGLHLSAELLRIRNDIPIILCTGHSDAVSPETAREAGIREFLMKPLAKREVAEAIRRVMNTKSEE
jgi:CheY-like chemotaxis protein